MNEWFARAVVYNLLQFLRGEKISNYLQEISHIPSLPYDEIKKIQIAKLRNTLHIAYNNIPFYHRLFDEAGIEPDKLQLVEDFKSIPTLSKDMLRSHYDTEFINRNIKRRVSKETTSGSSGNPLTVVKHRDKSAKLRAVMYRCYKQYGIEIGSRQGRFWGLPLAQKNILKEKFKDLIGNRIRLSAFDIHEKSLIDFTERLKKFKPRYFYGYPSVLHKYATWVLEKGYELSELKLSVIITTGEILYNFQRKAIESAFGCKVANEYGSTEFGVIAFECEKGKLHINSDHVYVETDEKNELVITELNNIYNPLIRYKIGDRGIVSNQRCDCGINFPVISSLAGRDSTFIVTPDGRYVNDAILEYTFASGIKQFQAVQNSINELDIKIVKKPILTERKMQEYKQILRKHLGTSIKIKYEFVPYIKRDKSGKLRYFISNIEG